MSVETKTVSDQTNGASGNGGDISGELDRMKAHQAKLLAELKTAREKLSEQASKEQEREQALLAEQGKYKEAHDNAQKLLKQKDEELSAKDKAYAKNVFNKEVKAVASSLGARSEALDDIVKVGDWSAIEIDDNFNVNQEQLKAQIQALSKQKPFYFSANPPRPNDVQTGSGGTITSKPIDKMSRDELKEHILKMG